MSYKSKDRRGEDPKDEDRRTYGLTSSSDPKLLNCRVFIGNAPTEKATKADFEDKFAKYGKVMAVAVHRGFVFVQFEREEDAQEAVRQENAGLFKGFKIDVCMAAARQRYRDNRSSERRRSPPYGDKGRDYRDRSPVRERSFDNDRGHIDRFPREDRLRDDRARDSFDGGRRRPFDDPLSDRRFDSRDDPLRFPRRDSFLDPFREPFVAKATEYPHDCEIIVPNKLQRTYAELVESRLKNLGIRVDLLFPHEATTIPEVLDDITRRGCRYAVVVMPQNEQHKSATVNILWGTPQEHRNMPLDDAMSLIARSFDTYLQSIRDKVPVAVTPVVPVREAALAVKNPTPAADGTVQVLLSLLADNRPLSVPELDKVIRHLQERKKRLLEEVEAPTVTEITAPPSVKRAPKLADSLPITAPSTRKEIENQQAELQKRILSILNNTPSTATPTPAPAPAPAPAPSNSAAISSAQQPLTSNPNPIPNLNSNPNPNPVQSNTSTVINFDNPSVQKALDNLIQSGPSLLRTLQGGSQNLIGMQTPPNQQQAASPPSQQFPIPGLGQRDSQHSQQLPHHPQQQQQRQQQQQQQHHPQQQQQQQQLPGLGGGPMRNPSPMNQQRLPMAANMMGFMGRGSMMDRY